MKHLARRLMSLLMVLAILCTMVPAAMAASYTDDDGIKWYYDCTHSSGEHDPEIDDDETDEDYEVFYCADCREEGWRSHDWVYEYYNPTYHTVWCANRDCYYYDHDFDERHDSSSRCVCDYNYSYYDVDLEIDTYDDLSTGDTYEYDDDVKLEVEVTVYDGNTNITSDCWFEFDWTGDVDDDYDEENDDGYSYAYMDTSGSYADVTCYVTVYDDYYDDVIAEDEVTWSAEEADGYYYDEDIVVEATVYNTSSGYQFDEEDDEGYDSIEDQIADAIYDMDKDYEFEYVEFSTVSVSGKGELSASKRTDYYYYDSADYNSRTDEFLEDVVFYPDEDYDGEVDFPFTAYYYDGNSLDSVSGVIVFDVVGGGSGQGGDILYTAESGEEVYLDEDDFEDFWADEYPGGDLEYVTFTSVSSGYLYDNYDGGSKSWTDVESARSKCYLDPTSRQLGLDDLTYVPGRSTVSATIRFTAHGTTGSGSRTDDVSGTVTILYIDEDVTPIEYDTAGNAVTLDSDDFIDKYEDVISAKRSGAVQIKFLEAPTDGTLYVNYSSTSSGRVSGTALTAKNIGSYTFSSSTSAAYSIEDVTYVPGTRFVGDTLEFACYNNNQLRFIGTVRFNSMEPISIELSCTRAGMTFQASNIFNSSNSSLLGGQIVFGNPTSGALYTGYANGTGTKVTSSARFTSNNISSVTFIPSSVGLATIPFLGYTSTGGQVIGTIKITVTAYTFTDVPFGSYYYDAVQWAVANGVTTGTTTGANATFSPAMTCTRGQVVTFLWRAKGCPEPKTTVNPFTDIKPTDYHYKAVLWAAENGITTGTTTGANATFSPEQTCTSGQVVTFLWRANGRPAVAHTGTEFYAEAVAWANLNGLLSGTGAAFNPNNLSPRSEIITYLYRAAR